MHKEYLEKTDAAYREARLVFFIPNKENVNASRVGKPERHGVTETAEGVRGRLLSNRFSAECSSPDLHSFLRRRRGELDAADLE